MIALPGFGPSAARLAQPGEDAWELTFLPAPGRGGPEGPKREKG